MTGGQRRILSILVAGLLGLAPAAVAEPAPDLEPDLELAALVPPPPPRDTGERCTADGERFDVVLAMEVIEHVSDPPAFLAACRALLRPGGLLICSTLNRNPKSWLIAIVGAEQVMRWLPVGTHDWRRFITPDELDTLLRGAGLEPVDRKGFVFDPLGWSWRLSDRDLSVNYVAAAVRPADPPG